MSGKTVPVTCQENVDWLVMIISGQLCFTSELTHGIIPIHSLDREENRIARVVSEIYYCKSKCDGNIARCPIARLK